MWLAALSALQVAVAVGPAQARPVKAKIPGQQVEVSIDIPGFAPAKELPNPGRCLLYGRMKDDVLISVLWEENFPYVGAAECPAVYSKEQGFHSFTVGGKTCCQFRTEIAGAIGSSQFYAFLATPDFLFTIHASRATRLKAPGGAKELKRSDMESIAKSLEVAGQADRGPFAFPADVYGFRDEAARVDEGQLDWVKKQCAARPGDWVPHFYLGQLAYNRHDVDVTIRGYEHAAELLAQRSDRSKKETMALLTSLDKRGGCFAELKKFDQAVAVCLQILQFAAATDPQDIRSFREVALFNLACCYAMSSKPDDALNYLRQAIAARPEYKKRAAEEVWLASLRSKPEFKRLVGN